MATYKPDLVRKIVRLLESNHDGERAAAAGKLAAMAKEQKHNVDEMLAMVYGSGSLREASEARPRSSSWDDLWRRTEEATRRAEQARRERQNAEAKAAADRAARQREREQAARQEERAFREEQRRASQPNFGEDAAGFDSARVSEDLRFDEPLLRKAYALWVQWGDRPLSVWELNFMRDVTSRGQNYQTTSAQDGVLRNIIEKLTAAARRNGDAESFWHS